MVHSGGTPVKQVVSVSLGSTHRDHEAELTILGETVKVARQGTDGDPERARQRIRELDGTVDAIGLGGIDRYLVVRDRRYEIPLARQLAEASRHTPVVDGSGVKATWEYDVIGQLTAAGILDTDQPVLLVSSMDRFGMAEAFFDLGFPTVAGDLIFASHIHYPIRSLGELEELARKLLPELVKLPFAQLYPVGEEQRQESDPRYADYFDAAHIIAGDFHYIRRYLPPRLTGKTVITNTTTRADIALLRERGVRRVITTTPVLEGRSFGTNVIEAALVAVSGLSADDPDWPRLVRSAGLAPTIRDLTTE